MQKSIIVPIILMLMMAIPAFGLPQGNSTDYNQIPVESHPTVINAQQEPMQESMQELSGTGNITAGTAPLKV